MNELVEKCRSEWRRLGVPDPVADEMAAELAADLAEAEAEGASAEELLGSGAFDPRSFATAWAAERGVIRRPPSQPGLLRRLRIPAAIGAFALIATFGAVLVILASRSTPTRLSVASPVDPPMRVFVRALPPSATRIVVAPDGDDALIQMTAGARTVSVDINDSGVDTRIVGSVLLTVGLAGVVPLTMFWLWVGPEGWSRRRTYLDDRASGPAD